MIVFNALEKEHIDLIIEIELKTICSCSRIRISVESFRQSQSCSIADKGFDRQFGARPIKAFKKYVEDTLAEEIITSK